MGTQMSMSWQVAYAADIRSGSRKRSFRREAQLFIVVTCWAYYYLSSYNLYRLHDLFHKKRIFFQDERGNEKTSNMIGGSNKSSNEMYLVSEVKHVEEAQVEDAVEAEEARH